MRYITFFIVNILFICATVFADQTEDYVVSILFPDNPNQTTFELHSTKVGDTPTDSIGMISTGKVLGTNEKCTVGKVYVQINRGGDDWELLVCAKNMNPSPYDQPILYNLGAMVGALALKYRNAIIFGEDTDPLGTTVSFDHWYNPANPNVVLYKWFVNSPTGGCSAITDPAKRSYATLATSNDSISGRIQLTFAVDLLGVYPNPPDGLYSLPLEMELVIN